MKKNILLLTVSLAFLGAIQLNAAADGEEEFVKLAKRAAPEFYYLVAAGKMNPPEKYFAVYNPTKEEPQMKRYFEEKVRHDAWFERSIRRSWVVDSSDQEPERSKYPGDDILKVKVGSKSKLEEFLNATMEAYRGGGYRISWSDMELYLPGPQNAKPSLTRSKLDPDNLDEEAEEALYALDEEDFYKAICDVLDLQLFYYSWKE